MTIIDVPFAVLRVQYQIARFPLLLIEQQMATWLPAEAPARLFYERSLGALDTTVGNLLGNPELQTRGAALVERSDAVGHAAHLDAIASQTREQADDELKAKRDQAHEDQTEARTAKDQEIEQARATAEERKRAAADEAAKRTAAAKRQADEAADQQVTAAEAAKRDEQAKITAAEQKATAAAESKRDDAQAKRSDAESKRAQADRVEELADAEKQKRQAERANNTSARP